MMIRDYGIPRRSRLDLNTPAELAITNAMYEIEKLPADVRLTEAVNLLSKAKEKLSDYVDEKIAAPKEVKYEGGLNEF